MYFGNMTRGNADAIPTTDGTMAGVVFGGAFLGDVAWCPSGLALA